MASVLGNVVFGLVMMVVGGMIALLMIVWEMITHPRTVFKNVPRNGKSSCHVCAAPQFWGTYSLVSLDRLGAYTCSLVPSPKRAWDKDVEKIVEP